MKIIATIITLGMFLANGGYLQQKESHTVKWQNKLGLTEAQVNQTDPRTKDPAKCTKVCTPEGYDGEFPKEFPEGVETVECEGDYCAKAGHHDSVPPGEEGPDDGEESCKAHYSCSVHCSEVCCVCLRECI